MTVVEICVEDAVGVRRARDGGADRIEICTDLSCGGLTPAFDEVAAALEVAPAGGVQVLVRPRPGNFVHSREEVDRIASDIVTLRAIGRGSPVRLGFVVGVLADDGSINVDAAARLRDIAEDAPLTFHRGFDQVLDQDRGLDVLMELGYDRLLSPRRWRAWSSAGERTSSSSSRAACAPTTLPRSWWPRVLARSTCVPLEPPVPIKPRSSELSPPCTDNSARAFWNITLDSSDKSTSAV